MRTTDQKYAYTLSSRVPNIATIDRRETRPVKVEISLIFNKPNVCSRSSLTPGTSSFVEYPSVSPSRYISFEGDLLNDECQRFFTVHLQLVRLYSSVVVALTTRHPVTSETASFAFPFVYDLALTFSDVYIILYLG